MPAKSDLDRDMGRAGDRREAVLVVGRRLRIVGDNGDHGRVVARADPPKMQVGDAIIVTFERPANGLLAPAIGHSVEENGPVSRMSPHDQRGITTAPTRPMSGSIHTQP